MKYKPDWVAIGAAVGIAFLMHVILTFDDSLIFPSFLGAILLQSVVSRTARHS